MTSTENIKKRKITCIIRGDDSDLEAVEKARKASYNNQRYIMTRDLKDAVLGMTNSNSDGVDEKLEKALDNIEDRVKELRAFILAGVPDIDFDDVDDE